MKSTSTKKKFKRSAVKSRDEDSKRASVVRCINSLPRGKVSTYGAVARAAGWPNAARQVAQVLRHVKGLPWHRVLGAGGAIKLQGEHAADQKFGLQMEGVTFRGRRVDMSKHEHKFKQKRVNRD